MPVRDYDPVLAVIEAHPDRPFFHSLCPAAGRGRHGSDVVSAFSTIPGAGAVRCLAAGSPAVLSSDPSTLFDADAAVLGTRSIPPSELTGILSQLERLAVPCVVAADPHQPELPRDVLEFCAAHDIAVVQEDITRQEGMEELGGALAACLPRWVMHPQPFTAGLCHPGDAVLVTVSGRAGYGEAGFLERILEELARSGSVAVQTGPAGVQDALGLLKEPPVLAVCDLHSLRDVTAQLPTGIPVTVPGAMFARSMGVLNQMASGAMGLDGLRSDASVLLAGVGDRPDMEALSTYLNERAGGRVQFFQHGLDDVSVSGGDGLAGYAGAVLAASPDRAGAFRRSARRFMALGVPVTLPSLATAAFSAALNRVLTPLHAIPSPRPVRRNTPAPVSPGERYNVYAGSNLAATYLVLPADDSPKSTVPFNLLFLFGDLTVSKERIPLSSLPFARGGQRKIRKIVAEKGYCFYKWPGKVLGGDLVDVLDLL